MKRGAQKARSGVDTRRYPLVPPTDGEVAAKTQKNRNDLDAEYDRLPTAQTAHSYDRLNIYGCHTTEKEQYKLL